jgi:NAD(P)-dependent dehydrogenase (short-subunit alcohol dehydrogenase family)
VTDGVTHEYLFDGRAVEVLRGYLFILFSSCSSRPITIRMLDPHVLFPNGASCTVVATTRFPNSAAATYRREADFSQWSTRLHVYGLDLRDVTGLEAFTRFLKRKYSDNGIDILINNACQTVRRPRGYYTPLVNREQELWKGADFTHQALLDGCVDFERVRRQLVVDHAPSGPSIGVQAGQIKDSGATAQDVPMVQIGIDVKQPAAHEAPFPSTSSAQLVPATSTNNIGSGADKNNAPVSFETTGLSHAAAMSQLVIIPEDVGVSSSVLPPGLEDINGHQLDLRSHNSWLLKMEEVSTPEVMECMFVNAIAPFVLNSRLQPLMSTPPSSHRPDRYIINVSAMEGKFYRYKMPNHPHTNMAKAALNMLTRTSSEDLAKSHRIYMNSVDTGT